MKRFIIIIGLLVIPLTAIYQTTYYNRTNCIIKKVEGSTVQVADIKGNLWTLENVTGFAVGDKVTLKMHDNFTPNNIKDDKIIEVKR